MHTDARPIAPKERIYTLDVIRGFALFGIFIMNMPWFNTSFYSGIDGTEHWPEWWDTWTETATDVLFAGKFNSMFSMLFAIGFVLQLDRLEQRDPAHAKAIYLRRISWLFAFGVTHLLVFWNGDVLHLYAVFGLLLLALRRAPEKLLWTLFALCTVFPVAMGLWRMLNFSPAARDHVVAMSQAWEASNHAAYGHGSFFEALREHVREALHAYSEPSELRRLAVFCSAILATMLLGLVTARRRFFQEAATKMPWVRRLQWWSLVLGLATGAVFAVWENTVTDRITPTPFKLIAMQCFFFCRVFIMVFYVATILRCAHSATWGPRLGAFAVAGRMPLTNYLLQTLIATTLFYGWGFGLWGKVGPALDLALAIAIFFVVQVPLSKWWLARFELGPMEWLWRRLTYGSMSARPDAMRPQRFNTQSAANTSNR